MKPSLGGNANGRAVISDVVEFAAPIVFGSAPVSFVVRVEHVRRGARQLVEQHPDRGPITCDVPTSAASAIYWSA